MFGSQQLVLAGMLGEFLGETPVVGEGTRSEQSWSQQSPHSRARAQAAWLQLLPHVPVACWPYVSSAVKAKEQNKPR